jgi:hypothetical protein
MAALLLAALLSAAPGEAPPRFRAGLELSAQALPFGTWYATALPVLSWDGGEAFGVELGAPLRFGERGLRAQDWDAPDDFGQLLRELRLGREADTMFLRAGTLSAVTLGTGRLLRRYDAGLNPDHHPASAWLTLQEGELRGEAFASNVLGARLFALDVRWDAGRRLGLPEDLLHVAASAAHDAGLGGGTSPQSTLAVVEVDGTFLRAQSLSAAVVASGGARLGAPGGGAAAGGLVDASIRGVALSVQLEGRWQRDGFRHGYFGPDYELRRFSGMGTAARALADERLEPGFSVAGTVQLQAPRTSGGEAPWAVVLSAERFYDGRLDADGAASLLLGEGRYAVAVRGGVTGLFEDARAWGQLEGRARVGPAFYVVASGGTVFFPEPVVGAPGSTRLRPGVQASLGLGMDLAR